MMNNGDDKLSAVLTGMATSAAVHVLRQNTDTQNRIDRQRDDLDSVNRRLSDLLSNGHVIREMMPVVADLLSGIALAQAEQPTASLVPSLSSIARPALINVLQTAISNFSWPPKQGEYNATGYIEKTGELASLGLILTFEEVRCVLTGLVLPDQPNTQQKVQSFVAAQALMQAIVARQYTFAQWKATWERLFGSAPHPGGPVVTSLSSVASVTAMTGAKDSTLVLKMNVSGSGLSAGTQIAKVTFGTRYENVPAVIAGGPFQIEALSSADFVVVARQVFANGDVVTIPLIVGSTDA